MQNGLKMARASQIPKRGPGLSKAPGATKSTKQPKQPGQLEEKVATQHYNQIKVQVQELASQLSSN